MDNLQIPNVDLECGCQSYDEADKESICFSDADEGSCNSQFYSTADGDGSYDDYGFDYGSEILEDEGLDLSDCDTVDVESGEMISEIERDCRICHLSLVSSSPGCGIAIELGCSCKDDLAAAHKQCAETWFKIKGNKTCEICNSVARNIVGPNDMEAIQLVNEDATTSSDPTQSGAETRTCLNGHRFLNFLLACMVFAFIISWLFHFNIPS